MYIHCKYPSCTFPVLHFDCFLCETCYDKVSRFELALDDWLKINCDSLILEDVLGWYTYCPLEKCERDCLEEPEISIFHCNCCKHKQNLVYNNEIITNMTMPTMYWITQNILIS